MARSGSRHLGMNLLAPLVGALVLSGMLFAPASAHSRSNYKKERKHIKERALSQLGAPYRYGGESSSGFDCSGFTSWVYDDHGGNLPRTALGQFRKAKNDRPRRVWKRSHLRKGDLVFFKTTSSRVGHAGIYIGHGKFISSTSSSGVRRDSVWDPYYWGPRYVGATRLAATRKIFG
jgi:cell wall-associated NlpC family hydrolase